MENNIETLFTSLKLKNITLPNRIIRSATYEGCGINGVPTAKLIDMYKKLTTGGVGTIITGFVYISQTGRAMQPGQCGIDNDDKINAWKEVVSQIKNSNKDIKMFMQIAHTGRQTLSKVTGKSVVGASAKKCSYFKQRVKKLNDKEIQSIIEEFADAAFRAKQAGFDGIQIHAAHGYLIHQFLSPWTNTRNDQWAQKTLFLEKIIKAIQKKCGNNFPILIKLSASDDNKPGITLNDTINTIKSIEHLNIDAIEISYGTMEYALNIIRGAWPIDTIFKVNPLFKRIPKFFQWIWGKLFLKKYLKKLISFSTNYNMDAAIKIKEQTNIPIIPVGGIRNVNDMLQIMNRLDAVSLCRPLICEPDFVNKIRFDRQKFSKCINCNLCTVYCDSHNTLRCYISEALK